ncbi:MAG TPA: hypothetical protein VGX37_13755 [Allosphingosinicella sp.]|jgi:hypothetical protein|nr:hypothetical protein [Allosphingosinicella sp.]
MRHFFLLFFLLAAGPAAAQELGQRTQPPEAMVPGLGLAPEEDDLRDAIAAADAHPLGSVQNPVRVGGPAGERAYLARLRCADGSAPRIGGRSDAGIGAFGSVVGAYALTCGAATSSIAFDIYHEEHVETRAPQGFTILPD